MGWGHWRVPEITEEVEFRLTVQALEVRAVFQRDPQAVLRQALLLAREKAMLEGIVEKAARRITELEAAAAVMPPTTSRPTKNSWRPWWC